MDLSSPRGHSVNDAISSSLSLLKYAALDQAVQMIQHIGPGTLLAKIDLQNAYRVVPIHPIDQPLLGLQWEKVVFQDTAPPFGLRSASKIFTAVAAALAWAMMSNGATGFLHYLDDFLFVGPQGSYLQAPRWRQPCRHAPPFPSRCPTKRQCTQPRH